MKIRKLLRNKKGVSSVISTLLIAGLMITSIALTYSFIVPTIDRANINTTINTSSLFMTKVDTAIQSLLFDGENASRTLDIDVESGLFDIETIGLNVRVFVNDSLLLPIPNLDYGLAKLDIPSDFAIMTRGETRYIKGSAYADLAVVEGSSQDPGLITLSRPESDQYEVSLWYRLILYIRDTGTDGIVDMTLLVLQFSTNDPTRTFNRNAYSLFIKKTAVTLNPTAFGFPGNEDPLQTSGDNFYVTANRGLGPQILYEAEGFRSNITFNIITMNFDFTVNELL
jgi:hypothetical protein